MSELDLSTSNIQGLTIGLNKEAQVRIAQNIFTSRGGHHHLARLLSLWETYRNSLHRPDQHGPERVADVQRSMVHLQVVEVTLFTLVSGSHGP